MTEKQKYNILVDHIKELANKIDVVKIKIKTNIQFVDAESLFKKN